jgi:uncharacterized damage-inducible protein DinB
MDSQQAKTLAEFLIGDFEYEMHTTMRVLQAAPSDRLDYKPDDKSKSALGLLRHITLEDEWFLNSIANGAFAPPPDDSDACGITSGSGAATRYQANIPPALNRVRGMSGEQLTKVMDLFGIMQLPTVNFLALALKHSIHHRGQLSAYLRAMGGKVPGIYGPSADTQQQQAAH